MSKFAWVTLTTNDTYSLGALVLAHSLRRAGTQHQLAVLVTPGVSESMRDKLKDVYNVVQEVNIMDSQDSANLALLARPELGITFTKLHCWRLVQFEKCVFLDSDTLVLQNCDELFEREEFSAAPDVSWPDCFNSGVFVYKPSQETFDKIVEFGVKNGSFDGGDQGLLNQYFADWATSDIKKRLPFLYNVTAYASYCYLPAFKQFRDKIKILHFAGKMKPWLIHYNSQSKTPSIPSDYSHAADLIQLWWNIFFDHVHQNLTDNMRYFLPALMAWKINYDDMIYQQQQQHHYELQQEHQQHATNMQYNSQYEHYQEHYTNKKIEFHDPWEDYYRKEETQAEIQTNGNEQNEENKWNNETEMQPQHQQQHHYDNVVTEYKENKWNNETEMQQQYQQQHHYDNVVTEYKENKLNNEKEMQSQQHQQQHYDNVATEYKENCNSEPENIQNEVKDDNATREISCDLVETLISDNNNDLVKIQTSDVRDNGNKDNEIENNEMENIKKHDNTNRSSSLECNKKQEECNNNTANPSIASRCDDNSVGDQTNEVQQVEVEEAGLAGALSHLRLGEPRTPEEDAYEQLMRRQCWESGQIDYSGRDSFENIWLKISQTMETKPDNKTGSS